MRPIVDQTDNPAPESIASADRPVAAPVSSLSVFFIALTFYFATALAFQQLDNPGLAYFDQLAASFVAGRLDLPSTPLTSDLTYHNGRWYVPFPPLPAMLLAPFVALTGGARVIALSMLMAALAGAATHACIRSLQANGRLAGDSHAADLAAASLATGVLWYSSVDGQVWYLGQVCAIGMFALAAWVATLPRGTWPSGVFLALAICGRPHMLLGCPFILALAPQSSRLRPRLVGMLLPSLIAIGGLAAYNEARFGDPRDFGYSRQNVEERLGAALDRHGQFSLHFVPRNLWLMTIKPPAVDLQNLRVHPDFVGMGMIWTLPILVVLLVPGRWMRSAVVRWAALSVGLIAVPLLLYYNGGWAQIGYRFSLDFLVPLTVCLAAAIPAVPPRLARALVVAGAAVSAWATFCWFVR